MADIDRQHIRKLQRHLCPEGHDQHRLIGNGAKGLNALSQEVLNGNIGISGTVDPDDDQVSGSVQIQERKAVVIVAVGEVDAQPGIIQINRDGVLNQLKGMVAEHLHLVLTGMLPGAILQQLPPLWFLLKYIFLKF